MTKEQEEAVERLEKRIKDNEDYKTTQVWLTDDVSAVYTVLNMLKDYVKEIEKKDKIIDLMARTISNNIVITHFNDTENVKKYYEKLVERK